MSIQPCLNFQGRCEEAVEFYRRAIGAEVTMLHRQPDRVMRASLRVGGTTITAIDGDCTGRPSFDGFALSITAPDGAGAGRIFAALGDGGRVRMARPDEPFRDSFGVVVDRFGVSWVVSVAA